MRIRALVLLAVAGCGNPSKLDLDRSADVDALWDLAPDGVELGIVASPRAMELATHAIGALRDVVRQPDFAPAKPTVDALLGGLLGNPTATPFDAGFSTDRGFALFITADGVLGVMPVGDRDKYMAAKHGTRGADVDTLEGNTCKTLRGLYVCATSDKMFDRVGKGAMRGKPSIAGRRGDIELFAPDFALLANAKGDLALTAQLDPGQVSLQGKWTGTAGGMLAKLVGLSAPHPDAEGASGFIMLDVTPLIAGAPAVPLGAGVAFDQFAQSLKGPVSAVIPSGSIDIQVRVPLNDPGPANTLIEHCKDLSMFQLASTQTAGACRIALQGTTALELDTWVENNELRLAAHKGAPSPPTTEGVTVFGRELASGSWSGAFWGRGTMLNGAGIAPATAELPPPTAASIHAIALVNELGAAVKVEATGIRFRGLLRTAWANPDDVVAKVIAFSGDDIVHGKATGPAKAIAAAAPASPFARDYAAGQGGLMIPAAAIGIASAVVVPTVMRAMRGPEPEPTEPATPPGSVKMDETQLVKLLLTGYMEEAYPKWAAAHPNVSCPASLDELEKFLDAPPDLPTKIDPWQHPLVLVCGKGLPAGVKLGVLSLGPDGKRGTADDVTSW